jgi:hypothetical protein
MHYERAPHFKRLKLDVAPPPLRCAGASLRCGGARGAVGAAKKLQQGLGRMAGKWHFTLGERYTLARITFPPRRQLK